jgi:hypothetical protein
VGAWRIGLGERVERYRNDRFAERLGKGCFLRLAMPKVCKLTTQLMLTTLLLNENTPIILAAYMLGAGTAGFLLLLLGMAIWAARPLRIASSVLLLGFYLLALWIWGGYLFLDSGLWVVPILGFGLCCYVVYRAVTARRPTS